MQADVTLTQVVVATNIAETSITIPDVVVVIDSGRQKEQRYDAKRGMASLVEAWVSKVGTWLGQACPIGLFLLSVEDACQVKVVLLKPLSRRRYGSANRMV